MGGTGIASPVSATHARAEKQTQPGSSAGGLGGIVAHSGAARPAVAGGGLGAHRRRGWILEKGERGCVRCERGENQWTKFSTAELMVQGRGVGGPGELGGGRAFSSAHDPGVQTIKFGAKPSSSAPGLDLNHLQAVGVCVSTETRVHGTRLTGAGGGRCGIQDPAGGAVAAATHGTAGPAKQL